MIRTELATKKTNNVRELSTSLTPIPHNYPSPPSPTALRTYNRHIDCSIDEALWIRGHTAVLAPICLLHRPEHEGAVLVGHVTRPVEDQLAVRVQFHPAHSGRGAARRAAIEPTRFAELQTATDRPRSELELLWKADRWRSGGSTHIGDMAAGDIVGAG